MERFAQETGIFGMHMVRQHTSKSERIFWVIVTVAFLAFTTKDLVTLVSNYLDEATLTSVTMVKNESLIFSPPPSLTFRLLDSFLNRLSSMAVEDSRSNRSVSETSKFE